MAYMDYGAIAFKNGKLISTDIFTPMIDMVGWEDTEDELREKAIRWVEWANNADPKEYELFPELH